MCVCGILPTQDKKISYLFSFEFIFRHMKRQRQKEFEAMFIDILLLLLMGKSWISAFCHMYLMTVFLNLYN